MTRRHNRQVVTYNRFGMKRVRTVQVRGHRHDFAKPHPMRPQVHRAGRNAKRGYRHGQRGHNARAWLFYGLFLGELVAWFSWGVAGALGFAFTVLAALGIRAGMEARKARSRRAALRSP